MTTKDLLKIQEERLSIALAWEKDKGIPNPETSAIIKSIEELKEGKTGGKDGENKTSESQSAW